MQVRSKYGAYYVFLPSFYLFIFLKKLSTCHPKYNMGKKNLMREKNHNFLFFIFFW
jgi:hypothetical protein